VKWDILKEEKGIKNELECAKGQTAWDEG